MIRLEVGGSWSAIGAGSGRESGRETGQECNAGWHAVARFMWGDMLGWDWAEGSPRWTTQSRSKRRTGWRRGPAAAAAEPAQSDLRCRSHEQDPGGLPGERESGHNTIQHNLRLRPRCV